MQLQIAKSQILQAIKYPSNTIIVEWLDSKNKALAITMAKHAYRFQSYDNDREYSHFLEQISWLESEVLCEIKKIFPQIYRRVKISGRLVITNEKGEVVYYQN